MPVISLEVGRGAPLIPVLIKNLDGTKQFWGIGAIDPAFAKCRVDCVVLEQLGSPESCFAESDELPEFGVQIAVRGKIGDSTVELVQEIVVVEADFSQSAEPEVHVILGRNFLERCIFVYDGLSGRFTLAF